MSLEFLKEQVQNMIDLLNLEPAWEIRVLDPAGGRPAEAGIFDNVTTCVFECVRFCDYKQLYIGLQPRGDEGLRIDNVIRRRNRMTRDLDISRILNIGVDIDAVREYWLPASEQELGLVKEKVCQISELLQKLGIPRPIEVLSGNGVQLILPIAELKLPKNGDFRRRVVDIIKAFESWVRERIQTEHVKVDSIGNLSRVVRLPGAKNIKGVRGPDRPHRTSRILWAPQKRVEIDFERIEEIVGGIQELGTRNDSRDTYHSDKSDLAYRPADTNESSTRECCIAIKRLWNEGFTDRSKAIWDMCLYFGFIGEPKASAVGALMDYNKQVTKKPGANVKYMDYWYERAVTSNPTIPCASLLSMGHCPGVSKCDFGEHSLELPNRPVVSLERVSSFSQTCFQKGDPMWNPKEIAESLEIEPGVYRGRIVDAFDGNSQTSGAEMTTVVVEIEDKVGTRIFEHLVKNHPVHRRRTMALLGALGMLNRKKVECKDLIGKNLKVRVSVEKFEGLPQARIKKFMAADETGEKK